MDKRAIILPFKESFDAKHSGAASIFVKESLTKEKLNNFIIYGSPCKVEKKYKKIFYSNKLKTKYFRNYNYIKQFINNFKNINFKTIEIHNRPEYVKNIKKAYPRTKIIFYFHNDPLSLRGSRLFKDRKFIYENCDVIFLSRWIKNRFEQNDFKNKNNIVIYPGIKKISKNLNKKNIIFFCGKLNHAKGYDIFIEATKKFKQHKKFSNWKIISAGTESRRTINKEKHVKELGQISNKKVIEYYKKSKISVAPSNWDEPLGRLPLESSSMGCLPITSSKGGLPETNLNGIILNNNTSSELYNVLCKLASNPKKLNYLNNKVLKNFNFTDLYFNKLISKIRHINIGKIKKILFISNLNLKNKKRLFYSFFNKLKKGLSNSKLKVNYISDRDFIRENRSILDITGVKRFNLKILKSVKQIKPDLIILGHTDRIDIETFEKITLINKNIKIIKIYIDSISNEFFNFNKVFYDYNFLDKIFISSDPVKLKNIDINNKIKFIPYPVLKEIDYLKSFNFKRKDIDVLFALSHGQNRGKLKYGRVDEREYFINKIKKKISNNVKCKFIGTEGIQPIWGRDFYKILERSKITINLSRGIYKKLYSSDRISTLIGNGSFVLNEKINNYSKFFNEKDELINFKNVNDLVKKINYFLKKDKLRYRIAKKAYSKYHEYFNINIIIKYLFDVIDNKNIKKKYIWS